MIVKLRKLRPSDKQYFAVWWRDKVLYVLTSGFSLKGEIFDQEIEHYFLKMIGDRVSRHFMIALGNKIIGHTALKKRKNNWHEITIVIGEKKMWGRGYGEQTMRLLLGKAKRLHIKKIFLEVRKDNKRAIRLYEKCGFKRVPSFGRARQTPATIKMIFQNR